MVEIQTQVQWEKDSLEKFNKMIRLIPLFHRDIARQVVEKKAEETAMQRQADEIEESDIVQAFFTEVPKAFYSLMIRLMDISGFDYKKYEPK